MIVESVSETISTEEWQQRITVQIETPVMGAIRGWISKWRISVIRGIISVFWCNDLFGISLIISWILRRSSRSSVLVEIWVEWLLVRTKPRIVIKGWWTVRLWTGSVTIALRLFVISRMKSIVVGAGIESRKSVIESIIWR